ncbi:MAG: hypothetical protein M3Y33_04405 [Actinomycetota bacterium]|nr:hypothetical protein [Actinomycetota bacterium]
MSVSVAAPAAASRPVVRQADLARMPALQVAKPFRSIFVYPFVQLDEDNRTLSGGL